MFQLCFYSTHFSLFLSCFSPARAPYPLLTLVFPETTHAKAPNTKEALKHCCNC